MYFTSWDANTYLCLLSVFPEEVVRGMIKLVKKTHEEFVRKETLDYHCNLARHFLYFAGLYFPPMAIQQLKQMWKWRCPEQRRNNIVKWANNSSDWRSKSVWEDAPYEFRGEGTTRTGAGYWNSNEAWSYSIKDRNLDTSQWEGYEEYEYFNMKERQRKEYVSDWYANIHEGRYFLFFKENDILSSDLYDKYRDEKYAVKSICELGERWQTAQDLLTLDGGGLGQKPGKYIKHIDEK